MNESEVTLSRIRPIKIRYEVIVQLYRSPQHRVTTTSQPLQVIFACTSILRPLQKDCVGEDLGVDNMAEGQ